MARTFTRLMKIVALALAGYVMAAGCVSNSILPQGTTFTNSAGAQADGVASGLSLIPNIADIAAVRLVLDPIKATARLAGQ